MRIEKAIKDLRKEMPRHCAKVSDKQIHEFIVWASKCGYPLTKEEIQVHGDGLHNAFRGFVFGCGYNLWG